MLGQFDGHRYSPQAVLYKAPDLINDAALIPKSVITLYQWINDGVCRTTNLDLFEKTRRHHHHRHRPVKRCLGANISQRPAAANERTEIGHWEVDTVQGQKNRQDSVLLVLTERYSRLNITRKIAGKTAQAVNQVFLELKQQLGEQTYYQTFKTLTPDNGTEFSELNEVHEHVYYADPYSPWERGSNENNNRFLRKEIIKGQAINDYRSEEIIAINRWLNNYPRQMFNGQSSLDIYRMALSEER